MDEKFRTIKVLPDTVNELNIISAITKEKQYKAISRLTKKEHERLLKTLSERGKKLIK